MFIGRERDIMISAKDKEAIEKSIATYTEAWNQRDMKLFSEVYTHDSTFVDVLGRVYLGKSAIGNRHLKMHDQKNSKLEIQQIDLREVRKDVVIALLKWRILNSGIPSPENVKSDTRHGIFTQVFLKEGNQWLVTASHNTFIADKH